MAFTHTVTKFSANEKDAKHCHIVFNLICFDDNIEVINKNFFICHGDGDDLSECYGDLLEKMQKEIDKYEHEKETISMAQVDTTVTYLQDNLVDI